MFDSFETSQIDQMLFYPRPARTGTSRVKGATDGTIMSGDAAELGYRLYPRAGGGAVILFFHGNGEVAPDYDDIAPLYWGAGASLLVVDYRGYGWSSGRPGIERLLPDAESAFAALPGILEAAGLGDGPHFVMGRSLGSAPAIHLASDHPDAWHGLIVESGFARVIPLLARLGFPLAGGARPDPIGNLDKVAGLQLPLLVLHGERDTLIPVSEGQALYDVSPARVKTIRRFAGAGHNDLLTYAEEYFEAVHSFLAAAG